MAWNGYFTLDGIEFINGPRTEAYAESAGAFWLRPQFKNDDLAPMLGQTPYTTPLLDTAPWVDPDVPESYDFFGYYPLDVTGIEDSSRTSTVTESTRDGGIPGRLRHASKSVVFNGVLVGASEKGVAYGAEWLRRALLGDLCNDDSDTGLGAELRFVSVEPHRDSNPATDPEATMYPLMRALRRFSVNSGPTVTSRRIIESCGGAVWNVTFTGVAGSPYTFGLERPILQGYLDPIVADPWVPGITPGTAESVATDWTDVVCGEDTWEPIYDPLCPALIVPPAPPAIPIGCYEAPVGTEITLTNPSTNPSVETNATNWSAVATSWTGARLASADAPKGGYVFRSTVNAAVPNTSTWALQAHSTNRIPATAGQFVGVRIRARVAPGLTRTIQWRLRAYAGGTAGPVGGFGIYTATLTDEWEEFVVSGILPAGQDGFSILASPTVFGEWVVGNWIEFDGLQPWYNEDPGPDSYFDGDTADTDVWTYSWTGSAHGSTSQAVGLGPAWDRRMATIPEDNVPLWGTVVPVLTLYAEAETRSVRVRLYADSEGTFDPDTEPCAYHTDLVVSYIPAGGRLVFDAAAEEVWVETSTGQRRRADSLVFNTEGEPFEWPSLSCGYQHVATVDVPYGTTPPVVDLALIPRAV